MHIRGATASNFCPCLEIVAVRPLFGVDESVLCGRGDLGFGENGGYDDTDVVLFVAGVINACVGAGWLEGGMGAIAAGL